MNIINHIFRNKLYTPLQPEQRAGSKKNSFFFKCGMKCDGRGRGEGEGGESGKVLFAGKLAIIYHKAFTQRMWT